MHLGLDIHGVIDQNLPYWGSLAQLVRLYFEAQDLLSKGRLDFPFTGARKDYLMWVKTGGERLEDLMSRCAEEATTTDGMYMCTTLPESADHEFLDKYCVDTLYSHLYSPDSSN